jgi:hypothetical protein
MNTIPIEPGTVEMEADPTIVANVGRHKETLWITFDEYSLRAFWRFDQCDLRKEEFLLLKCVGEKRGYPPLLGHRGESTTARLP